MKDRKSSKEPRDNLQIENITEVVRRARLRWFGHVERMKEENWVKPGIEERKGENSLKP